MPSSMRFTSAPSSPFSSAAVTLGVALALCGVQAAHAQAELTVSNPVNVASFQSSAAQEVAQDQMRITLSTTVDGEDAQATQEQLKKAIEAALQMAKPRAAAGKMEVTSGAFRINPRYGKDSKITGWQGYAEVLLEGTDFPRLTSTASAMKTLSMSGLGFGLAPATRRAAEEKAQSEAIETFRARAQQLTQAFGFSSYGIRSVNINGNDYGGVQPAIRGKFAMAASAPMADGDGGLPAEPGKTRVEVSVNGSIQMK